MAAAGVVARSTVNRPPDRSTQAWGGSPSGCPTKPLGRSSITRRSAHSRSLLSSCRLRHFTLRNASVGCCPEKTQRYRKFALKCRLYVLRLAKCYRLVVQAHSRAVRLESVAYTLVSWRYPHPAIWAKPGCVAANKAPRRTPNKHINKPILITPTPAQILLIIAVFLPRWGSQQAAKWPVIGVHVQPTFSTPTAPPAPDGFALWTRRENDEICRCSPTVATRPTLNNRP